MFASALLLAGCGASTGDPPGDDGKRAGAPPGDPAGLSKDGVRITAWGGGGEGGDDEQSPAAVEFEVTNREAEPFTYTVTFDFLSDSGGVLENARQVVPAVGPGRTVASTVGMPTTRPDSRDRPQVRIGKVRRVPTDEAPTGSGPCPASGVQLMADDGEAAMGLRVVGLRLTNCGTDAYHIEGYPSLGLLDEERQPVRGVRIVDGSGGVATVSGFDAPPRPVSLRPGETASAGLMWRNTTGSGVAANVPYVRVTAKPGAPPVVVTPELDLGTTGKLGVSAWKKEPAR